MSSSHPSAMSGKKRFVADTDGLPCPECSKETLAWLSGNCALLDGTVVPDLDYIHCSSCGHNLFDLQAMQRIREFRESLKPKAASRRRAAMRKGIEVSNA